MNIEIIPAYSHAQEIRQLFSEYTDMLAANDSGMRTYLAMQNYDAELENPEEKYGPPYGRLYIALSGAEPAGCIALRREDSETCELKRLYVRPQFRGERLGERLAQKIIDDARDIGYRRILLDTLPFLESAIHIYRKLGFREVARFNDSPIDTSIYMQLEL